MDYQGIFYIKRSNNQKEYVQIVDNFQSKNLEDLFPNLFHLNFSNHDIIPQNMKIKRQWLKQYKNQISS